MNVRPIELGRFVWGMTLIVRPAWVLTRVHHLRVDGPSETVARILGVRHTVQAVLSGIRPSPEVLAMGVWVDGVHALTAVGLAVLDRSRARGGLTDAVIALSWGALGWRDLGAAQTLYPQRARDPLARSVLRRVPGGGFLLRRT